MVETKREIIYKADILREFCVSILHKLGFDAPRAAALADSLLFADLRAVSSHGIVRLPLYAEKIETGIVRIDTDMPFVAQNGAACLLDAETGLGQLAGQKAMREAIRLADRHGVGFVAVRNSNHFGTAAWFALMAAERGQIGVAMANASPAIAPFGATRPLLGTNPLGIAIPAGERPPIVLDMAMSTVARGKIRLRALHGEPIPADWALDRAGNPTTSAEEALAGSLVPIGGAKGSALSLIIDILCGVLTDTCLTGDVKNITDMSGPSLTGHAFLSLNVAAFLDPQLFGRQMDRVIARIKSLEPKGDGPVYMAGEIEEQTARIRRAEGIPLPVRVVDQLNKLAEKIGVYRL